MFGEGYDFPKLKIAALHAPHRSLVPTLQFIGRFARTNDEATGPATLVTPVNRLKDASIKLFKEGVDIAELIDEVAQSEIAEAEADREVLDLLKPKKQLDSDYESVTPLLLELYAHAQIFECGSQPNFNLFSATIGRGLRIAKQWLSDDELVTLILTVDTSPPNWATSDALVNIRHGAFLLAFNQATNLCYIGSTRRTEKIYWNLMQSICPDNFRQISFERTRQALAGLAALKFYNVGLKNTAINSQAESYRVMTGPAADRAITAGDARAYSQGHFYGSGTNDGSERETIGASSSSRIWSNKRLTVAEYLAWISVLNNRLNGDGAIAKTKLDIIQHSRTLTALPEKIIAAGWHKQAYRSVPRVRFRNRNSDSWELAQITDLDLGNFSTSDDRSMMEFDVIHEVFSSKLKYSLSGGALIQGSGQNQVEVLSSHDDWEELSSWLTSHSPVFYSADKSSFQGVNLTAPPSNTISELLEEDTIPLSWENCAIDIEFDETKSDGKLTVHKSLERFISSKPNVVALIYDHRSGEAADFITVLLNNDSSVKIQLYHCKAAGGAPSGGRVGDIYEVAGQMLKSVAYCDSEVLLQHIRHRINPSRQSQPSHFIIGDIETTENTINSAPPTGLSFEIFGVQPGVSLTALDEHLTDLMAFGIDYVKRGGAATSAWIISP